MRGSTPGSPKIMARWHVWLWEAASLVAVFSGAYYRRWRWTKAQGFSLMSFYKKACPSVWQRRPSLWHPSTKFKPICNSQWLEELLHDPSSWTIYSLLISVRFSVKLLSSCFLPCLCISVTFVAPCQLQWFIPKDTIIKLQCLPPGMC